MSTLKNVIIIHGAGPRHYRSLEDGSGDWQSLLPAELGTEYKVLAPQMPSPKNPSYDEWKILFEKYLLRVKGDVVLVGHSLGGSFLVKYLAETKISQKISGLFLVATPYNTIKNFEVPGDVDKIRKIENIFIYHSMDDVEVPYAHATIFQEKLQGRLKTYTDQGHYFKRKKFVDLALDLKNIRIDSEISI